MHECMYMWASKLGFKTKLPSGRTAGEVVGQGKMIGESVAGSMGSMFSSNIEPIIIYDMK